MNGVVYVKIISKDGVDYTCLICPHCGNEIEIDNEQITGADLIRCPECGWHDVIDSTMIIWIN